CIVRYEDIHCHSIMENISGRVEADGRQARHGQMPGWFPPSSAHCVHERFCPGSTPELPHTRSMPERKWACDLLKVYVTAVLPAHAYSQPMPPLLLSVGDVCSMSSTRRRAPYRTFSA